MYKYQCGYFNNPTELKIEKNNNTTQKQDN